MKALVDKFAADNQFYGKQFEEVASKCSFYEQQFTEAARRVSLSELLLIQRAFSSHFLKLLAIKVAISMELSHQSLHQFLKFLFLVQSQPQNRIQAHWRGLDESVMHFPRKVHLNILPWRPSRGNIGVHLRIDWAI